RSLREQVYAIQLPRFRVGIGDFVFIARQEERCSRCSVRRLDLDQSLSTASVKRENVVARTIAIFLRDPADFPREIGQFQITELLALNFEHKFFTRLAK